MRGNGSTAFGTYEIELLEPRRLLSRTIYVDASATAGGTHDGSSWTAAYTNVSSALTVAAAGDQLRVANGTYKPAASDRTLSFQLKNGVKLYGGYAGYGAANPEARDLAQFPTILSGDVGSVGDPTDNAYHVINASGVDVTAVLDGFTVIAGNANGSTSPTNLGGGLYAVAGSPTVNQCVFSGNSCTKVGGAMYFDTSSSPTLTGCAFSGNSATSTLPAGGAISFSNGTISGCSFTNNSLVTTQSRGGGAIHIYALSAPYPAIADCTFSGNSGDVGGAVWTQAGLPTFNNCAFTGNRAKFEGGAASGGSTFVRCTFTGNSVTAANGTGGAVSLSSAFGQTLKLTACTFTRNTCLDSGGAVYGVLASLVATNCAFVANAAGKQGGALWISGNVKASTFANCSLVANAAPLGSAITGYELPITNTIVRGPSASLTAVIYSGSNSITVNNSDVQGGFAGTGNIDADPIFVRNPSAGADGKWGTADDDYGDLQLQFISPCVDAGNNASVPAGITSDVAGRPRFFDVPNAHDPGAIVDMGANELNTTVGILRVPDGQTLALPAGRHTFVVDQLSIGAGATLDVRDNALVVRGTTVDALRSMIHTGFDHGKWDGTGMTSSTAAADPTGATAIGFTSNAALKKTTFAGVVGLTSTDVLLKYTYYGDADLSGQTNVDDFTLFLNGYQHAGTDWLHGDFDYSGQTNLGDFAQFLFGYQHQASPIV